MQFFYYLNFFWRPSTPRFHMLCVLRCLSVLLWVAIWVTIDILSAQTICPVSSCHGLSHWAYIFQYLIFFFYVNINWNSQCVSAWLYALCSYYMIGWLADYFMVNYVWGILSCAMCHIWPGVPNVVERMTKAWNNKCPKVYMTPLSILRSFEVLHAHSFVKVQ